MLILHINIRENKATRCGEVLPICDWKGHALLNLISATKIRGQAMSEARRVVELDSVGFVAVWDRHHGQCIRSAANVQRNLWHGGSAGDGVA